MGNVGNRQKRSDKVGKRTRGCWKSLKNIRIDRLSLSMKPKVKDPNYDKCLINTKS